jgi:hypothetical protein
MFLNAAGVAVSTHMNGFPKTAGVDYFFADFFIKLSVVFETCEYVH